MMDDLLSFDPNRGAADSDSSHGGHSSMGTLSAISAIGPINHISPINGPGRPSGSAASAAVNASHLSPSNHPSATSPAALAYWLTLSLDHVGRGMLLVTEGGRVLHANRLARSALAGPGPALRLHDGLLQARNPREDKLLAEAIHNALHRGLRRMLTLGRGQPAGKPGAGPGSDSGGGTGSADHGHSGPITVAVLPIHPGTAGDLGAGMAPGIDSPAVLISLPQPSRTQDLAVQCWARQQGLTDAETAVLEALLEGQAPSAIAASKQVALSTVRSHLGKLRAKTESHTIRELLDRVAALPPMMVVVQ